MNTEKPNLNELPSIPAAIRILKKLKSTILEENLSNEMIVEKIEDGIAQLNVKGVGDVLHSYSKKS